MPRDKVQILEIIKDGKEAAESLNDKKLKESILGHFKSIEESVNDDLHLDELGPLARQLMIGVKEALCFNDMQILEQVEVSVRENIDYLRDRYK